MTILHKIAAATAILVLVFVLGRCSGISSQRAKSIAVVERNAEAKSNAAEQRAKDHTDIGAKHEDQINAIENADDVRRSAACQRLRGAGYTNLPAGC